MVGSKTEIPVTCVRHRRHLDARSCDGNGAPVRRDVDERPYLPTGVPMVGGGLPVRTVASDAARAREDRRRSREVVPSNGTTQAESGKAFVLLHFTQPEAFDRKSRSAAYIDRVATVRIRTSTPGCCRSAPAPRRTRPPRTLDPCELGRAARRTNQIALDDCAPALPRTAARILSCARVSRSGCRRDPVIATVPTLDHRGALSEPPLNRARPAGRIPPPTAPPRPPRSAVTRRRSASAVSTRMPRSSAVNAAPGLRWESATRAVGAGEGVAIASGSRSRRRRPGGSPVGDGGCRRGRQRGRWRWCGRRRGDGDGTSVGEGSPPRASAVRRRARVFHQRSKGGREQERQAPRRSGIASPPDGPSRTTGVRFRGRGRPPLLLQPHAVGVPTQVLGARPALEAVVRAEVHPGGGVDVLVRRDSDCAFGRQ